jgi:hypothetical protein
MDVLAVSRVITVARLNERGVIGVPVAKINKMFGHIAIVYP